MLMEGHCKTTEECIKRRTMCPCHLEKCIEGLEGEVKLLRGLVEVSGEVADRLAKELATAKEA